MSVPIFDDAEILRKITPKLAVTVMRSALEALSDGLLSAPPRISSDLETVKIDFTSGSFKNNWFGYRSNPTINGKEGEQIVTLHDYATGKIQAVSIGNVLGPLRTGAIGALAVDLMSRKTASTVTILGSGPQAWSQIWAISSVRDLSKVKIYSPNEQRRTALVQRIRTELEIDAIAADNEQTAVQDSDIIVLATNSRQPVINSEWLSPHAHINTLGPKYRGNSEFGTDLIERCKLAATDSPKQLETYADHLIFSKEQLNEVIGLSSLINKTDLNQLESRRPTIFLSVGLAGTEVFLLQALFNQ